MDANDEIKDHILWPVNLKSFLELALKKITHGCSPFFNQNRLQYLQYDGK